jgi:selT/selW/selH-like putative selenoprotein
MAAEIIMRWPEQIANVNLHAGAGGAYEVSVNGKQIWSKLECKQYPELKVVTDAITAVLEG